MKRSDITFGKYFCGNEISEYGRQNGYVDYATLAKSFDAVMCNDIFSAFPEVEQIHGFIDNSEEIEAIEEKMEELQEKIEDIRDTDYEEEAEKADRIEELENQIRILENDKYDLENEEYPEVFQWFIISDSGKSILEDYTNEIIYYCEPLDVYIWGVTHWGTAWDYVLTDIQCEKVTKEGEKA